MGYNLTKGQSYALDKTITKYYIGLGWDVNTLFNTFPYDLDVVVLLTDNNGKLLPYPNGVVFYNNPTYPACNWQNGTLRNENIIQQQPIWLSPDNRTGQGDGDDEYVNVDLQKIPQDVGQIIIAVVMHEATTRKQSFGQVTNAFVRIAQGENYPDQARYNITDKFTTETCLIMGRIYRQNNAWSFEASGKANSFSLQQLIDTLS